MARADRRHRPAEAPRRRRSRRRWILFSLIGLGVVFVALRAALPYGVKWYANRTLSEIPGYRGRIDDVDMNLWRGAYEIEGLSIVKTSGKVPVPFFSSPHIDLSVEWKELFHGDLVGEVIFTHPKINIVQGPTKETSQTDVDEPWQEKVQKLFPFKLNHFAVKNGEIHFRNFHSDPKVDVEMKDFFLEGHNLANSRDVAKSLVARISARGRPFHGAHFEGDIQLDPFAKRPTFNLDAKLTEVKLVELNDFLRAYGNFDVQSGEMSLYTELAAAEGRFQGYVKPLFTDLDVVDWKEAKKGPIQWAWEGLVGAIAQLFKNQPKDRFATRVPFSGTFDNPRAGILPTVGNVLRNAFIHALPPNLENSLTLPKVEHEAEEAKQATEGRRVNEQDEKDARGKGD